MSFSRVTEPNGAWVLDNPTSDGDNKLNENFIMLDELYSTYVNKQEHDNGDVSGQTEIDWSLSDFHSITLTGDVTLNFDVSSLTGARYILLKIKQDNVGSHSVTWPIDVYWQSGSPVSINSGADEVSIIRFYFDRTNIFQI